MRLNFGIREKLLAPMILGLIVIIASIIFLLLPKQLDIEKEEFIKDQTKLVKTLSPSIIQNILANDLSELHSVFENSILIHKEEWRYIELRDSDKKILYPIFTVVPELSETILSIKVIIEENDEIFGYVTLYTDWKKSKAEEQNKYKQLNLFAIVLFCVIGLLSFTIQTKWVYQPILKLKSVTHQFSLGNYEVALPKEANDEIGLLTHAVGKMRNKIQQSIERLTIEERKQRVILESVPDAIITINAQGEILSFNPSAEKIFMYKKEEIIGNNVKTIMTSEFASQHDNYIKNNTTSSFESKVIGNKRELLGLKSDGTIFPLELTINANVIDGEIIFTGILRDITERQKINQLKNDFVSTVSHELRTPLTAIKGSLDILIKGLDLELPDQANTMLELADRNVKRLLTLINDILDISKLESGEINFHVESIEVSPFIIGCIEINQEYAKAHKTKFIAEHINENIFIKVDKDRLTQVMSNLLSNAAKYSPANIPVEIFTSIKDNKLRINVRDHGNGVPEEFQAALFDKFTQSSSGDTRKVGGTGLGLNISKMIIEKLGGSIGFDTIINKETTFYFELPYYKKENIN